MAGVRASGGRLGFRMVAAVGAGIILGTTHLSTGAASGMIAAVRAILPKLAASIALRMIAAVGTGIR